MQGFQQELLELPERELALAHWQVLVPALVLRGPEQPWRRRQVMVMQAHQLLRAVWREWPWVLRQLV